MPFDEIDVVDDNYEDLNLKNLPIVDRDESESKPLKSVPIASKRTSPTTVAEFPMTNSNDKSDTVEEAQTQYLDFTATGEKATEKKYTRIKSIIEQYCILTTTEEDKDFEATNRGGSDLLKVNSRGSDAGDLESTSTTQEESQTPSVGSWAHDRLSITRTSVKVVSPPEEPYSPFEGSCAKRRMQISNTSIKEMRRKTTLHSSLSTPSLISAQGVEGGPRIVRRRSMRRRQNIDVNRSNLHSEDSIRPYSVARIVSALSTGEKTPSSKDLKKSTQDLQKLIRIERQRDWLISFYQLDPRYQINNFFNDVSREGAARIEDCNVSIKEEWRVPVQLRYFRKASAFSVFRPTSNDAIRKMMTGEGTGKGLDVKGKSAKTGKLSAFIPLIQIHEERHKKEVRWPPHDGSVRIYYKSEEIRKKAVEELTSLSNEMVNTVSEAKKIIANTCSDKAQHELALERLLLDVADPEVHLLENSYPSRFGIDIAERIFFNAYVHKNDISRSSTYNTGRPSEPAFQDMNLSCIRAKDKFSGPRAVVLQTSESVNSTLSPQSLVIAYEEDGNVTPVASDFDCFLVGTRGVNYVTPLSKDQVDLVKWLITQIETILDSPITSQSWTSRWLEVLKESASKGFYPEMPEFGFGDPKSYAIMEAVVSRMKNNGAVRHGAECFNYFFPQELDENFLVISDHLESNVPWKSVGVRELQDILINKIEMGYTFPLNPKWILADDGWKDVYDKMMASDNALVQNSLAVWYPPESGIRELIEDVYKRFPMGFQRSNIESVKQDITTEGTEAMDLAEQQLKRYLTLRRAKLKLRVVFRMMKMGNMI